ncbi:hypothetical protein [Noviherbaspirillum sp.]|jgi:type III secretory pathway component EscT|uniref:hypothetical protein n=1 Tax=Noviherbaspirillum sp. TaxID=1926288 RepID=UPI0025D018AF|nr:hypothetical protein [Noviherbaspirillum sp.]
MSRIKFWSALLSDVPLALLPALPEVSDALVPDDPLLEGEALSLELDELLLGALLGGFALEVSFWPVGLILPALFSFVMPEASGAVDCA